MAGQAESDERRRQGVDLATVFILRYGMYQGRIPADILRDIVRQYGALDAEGQAAARGIVTHYLQAEVDHAEEEARQAFDRWFNPSG